MYWNRVPNFQRLFFFFFCCVMSSIFHSLKLNFILWVGKNLLISVSFSMDFPGGSDSKAPIYNPWVGKIPWRRKWQSTPVLWPGKSHGQRSLVGYSPRGHKESEMTERLHFHFQVSICVLEKYWSFKYLNTEIILFVRVAIGKDVILSFATWSPCWLL